MKVALHSNSKELLEYWNGVIVGDKISSSSDKILFGNLKQNKIDIVFLDVGADLEGAKFLVEEILKAYPNTKIFALSKMPKFEEGRELLAVGVNGYANARMLDIHFKDAIKTINSGNSWLYPEFISQMIKVVNKIAPIQEQNLDMKSVLTPKEQTVAKLILDGFSNNEIAQNQKITTRTVKAHTKSIYEKYGVNDRISFILAIKNQG